MKGGGCQLQALTPLPPHKQNNIPLSLLGGLGLAGLGAFVVAFTSAGLGGGASGTPPMPRRSPIGAGDVLSTNDALSLPKCRNE